MPVAAQILSYCQIEFTDTAKAKHSFLYVIPNLGPDASFKILRTAGDGATTYTTTLGMTYLINRALSFLAGSLVVLLIVWGTARFVGRGA